MLFPYLAPVRISPVLHWTCLPPPETRNMLSGPQLGCDLLLAPRISLELCNQSPQVHFATFAKYRRVLLWHTIYSLDVLIMYGMYKDYLYGVLRQKLKWKI